MKLCCYTPRTTKLCWGYIGFTPSVCPSVRPACSVRSVAPSLFDRISSYVAQIHPIREWCVTYHFEVKGQGHTGRLIFWPCSLCSSLAIWWNFFLCGTNIPHKGMICHVPFLGQKSRSHGSFELLAMSASSVPRCVRAVAPWLFDGISSYVTQIHPKRGWCVAYHFEVDRSKVKVTQAVWTFGCLCSVAPWIFDGISSYMAQMHPIRRWCVTYHFLGQ